MASEATYEIGVDVGGTHTDVVVMHGDSVTHGKSFTTKEDLSIGVMDGLRVVSESLGVDLPHLLSNCGRMVNGTTVVTNAVTELRGRPVGALVTRGFRDTFRIARGPRLNIFDDHAQTAAPSIVPWDRIVEVTERLDYQGEMVAPLSDDDVREGAKQLVEAGAEAIAVVFLWSFKNPAHELRAKDLIKELYPDLYVVTSAEIHPLSREFERWNTALFTAFVREDVARYVSGLEQKLQSDGLSNEALSLFQCLGGTLLPREAVEQPLQLMDSGPVGGVIAARALARELGLDNVICADMGGTSFDVAIVRDGEFTHSKSRPLGHPALVTGLAAVDIVSIGAGGGSIGWTDRRGVPQVGPMSAGSRPGPACYGRGGTEPTVTDAMVALNFIDPDDYLRGRRPLDRDAALAALSSVGEHQGWTAEQTAIAIHDIAVSNMVNAIREVTVNKGHDPRDFTMLAYGGMTPLFACTVADQAGIPTVVVPPHSAAFSAWGVVLADRVRRYATTVTWNLDDPEQAGAVQALADKLVADARADAEAVGVSPDEVQVQRSGAFRFLGQVWEIDLPLDDAPLTPESTSLLRERFVARYEEIYGEGTAWQGAPVVLFDYQIMATVPGASQRFHAWTSGSTAPTPRGTRSVLLPDQRAAVDVDVLEDETVGAGARLDGPLIIDGGDTTIFIPASFSAERGDHGELRISRR
jgi:N-methylhydantoinase A